MLTLEDPALQRLTAYAAALATGWSPNTSRDVGGEQIAAITRSPAAFIADVGRREGGTARLPDGTPVPRLPGCVRWMWDEGFCGAINFRHVPGTEELPAHVSGHVGYAVVPWRRRRGYAARALRLMLPVAAAAGLRRVLVTCDDDNLGSRRVIETAGGVFAGTAADPERPGGSKLLFWVAAG